MPAGSKRPTLRTTTTTSASARQPRASKKRAGTGQRTRLLAAIVQVVATDGYARAKIGEIATCARVSRATFYEHFESKEQCFLAAHRQLGRQMSDEIEAAVACDDTGGVVENAVEALLEFAGREPSAFGFLTHEAMLAGPRALDERDLLMARLAEIVQAVRAKRPGINPWPDSLARMLIGGLIRMLGIRMRRSPGPPISMLADLIAWLDSASVPAEAQVWRRLTDRTVVLDRATNSVTAPMAPQPLPRGRHRLPATVVHQVQRQRIIHAVAETVRAKGYSDMTVADIVATAGVSREIFYGQFRDKQAAFLEAHKLVFEQCLAATAGAFFTSSDAWPERVWSSGRAFIGFVAGTPTLAHFAFVEGYATGRGVAQRTDEGIMAFTLFMEDGYRYSAQPAAVPRLLTEVIASIVMETVAFYVRHGRTEELPRLLGPITYLILAPFMGADAAQRFVARKLRQANASAATLAPPLPQGRPIPQAKQQSARKRK